MKALSMSWYLIYVVYIKVFQIWCFLCLIILQVFVIVIFNIFWIKRVKFLRLQIWVSVVSLLLHLGHYLLKYILCCWLVFCSPVATGLKVDYTLVDLGLGKIHRRKSSRYNWYFKFCFCWFSEIKESELAFFFIKLFRLQLWIQNMLLIGQQIRLRNYKIGETLNKTLSNPPLLCFASSTCKNTSFPFLKESNQTLRNLYQPLDEMGFQVYTKLILAYNQQILHHWLSGFSSFCLVHECKDLVTSIVVEVLWDI